MTRNINENQLTVSDIMNYVSSQLKENRGVDLKGKILKDTFIEALSRNLVMNEVMDMMVYITEQTMAGE